MRARERVGEIVRVGLNVLGVLILIVIAAYIGLAIRMAFIRWVADAQ